MIIYNKKNEGKVVRFYISVIFNNIEIGGKYNRCYNESYKNISVTYLDSNINLSVCILITKIGNNN